MGISGGDSGAGAGSTPGGDDILAFVVFKGPSVTSNA